MVYGILMPCRFVHCFTAASRSSSTMYSRSKAESYSSSPYGLFFSPVSLPCLLCMILLLGQNTLNQLWPHEQIANLIYYAPKSPQGQFIGAVFYLVSSKQALLDVLTNNFDHHRLPLVRVAVVFHQGIVCNLPDLLNEPLFDLVNRPVLGACNFCDFIHRYFRYATSVERRKFRIEIYAFYLLDFFRDEHFSEVVLVLIKKLLPFVNRLKDFGRQGCRRQVCE